MNQGRASIRETIAMPLKTPEVLERLAATPPKSSSTQRAREAIIKNMVTWTTILSTRTTYKQTTSERSDSKNAKEVRTLYK